MEMRKTEKHKKKKNGQVMKVTLTNIYFSLNKIFF